MTNAIIIPILPVNEEIEHIALECLRRTILFSSNYAIIAIINGENGGSERFQKEVDALADVSLVYPDKLGYAKAINEGLVVVGQMDPAPLYITIGSCDVYPAETWQSHLELPNPPSLRSPLDMSKTWAKDIGYRGHFWAAWWTMPAEVVVAALGPFDEAFNLRFAANDYAIRAHIAGYPSQRAIIRFDHVAAKHSSVGPDFNRQIRAEERAFRNRWQGAYNYDSWVKKQG